MKNIERIKQIFETESNELLDEVEQLTLALEADREDLDTVKQIFRNLHSIKGTAGMFGMEHTEYFLHAFEDLLDVMRAGSLEITPSLIDLVLKSIDHTKKIVKSAGKEIPEEIKEHSDELIDEFETILGKNNLQEEEDTKIQEVFWLVHISFEPEAEARDVTNTLEQFASIESSKLTFVPQHIPELSSYNPGEIFGSWLFRISQEKIAREELESLFDFVEHCNYRIDVSARPIDKDEATATEAEPEQHDQHDIDTETGNNMNMANDKQAETEEKTAESETAPADNSSSLKNGSAVEEFTQEEEKVSIRVDLDTLETLMNKVSELVLNRNQLLQYNRHNYDGLLNKYVTQLDRLTSEIQETAMNTRMEPVGNSWTRLPRIVRDLSKDLGKKVDLQLEGQSTELDRQIMEKLKEPIVHIIRNAIDHGIEAPDVRRTSDKPETGRLKLSAYSSAGNIFISIKDDGKGIDPEKLRSQIVSKGLLNAEEAEKLSDQQTISYLFESGFSTVDEVSKLSGRGVGLDVVKRNIEEIGGSIDVNSEPGVSTEFIIKIPLTLAVISAMTIKTGGKKFAISQLSVAELVWLNEDNVERVEKLNNQLVYQLRDTLVPLINLKNTLDLGNDDDIMDKTIVFIEGTDTTFGILVDEVDEIQEIVVKPLSRTLNHLNVYSGCTIVGNEEIVLILDVNGLCETANLNKEVERTIEDKAMYEQESGSDAKLLLFSYNDTQKAVPLDLVSRLEEFDREIIEQIDEDYVIQYRGKVLPLIPFREEIMDRLPERVPVLVLEDEDHPLGIVVEEFEDVIETTLESESISSKAGILSVEVIDGKTTEIIDLNWFYQRAKRIQLARSVQGVTAAGKAGCVLVEPSKFIRSHVGHVLSNLGFEVKSYEDLKSAVEQIGDLNDNVMLIAGYGALQENGWQKLCERPELAPLTKVVMGKPMDEINGAGSIFQLAIEDFSKEEIVHIISECTVELQSNTNGT